MTTNTKREVTRDDFLPMEVYAAERREWRRKLAEVKRDRRVEVGPVATFYFETYLTMWYQIHEMLFIEKGGKASSVQFVHFPFTPDQAAAFKVAGAEVVLGFSHPAYAHMIVLPEPTRAALAADLD